MILTDKEMDQVRNALEAQSGFDEELMRRCGHLIHLGAFDEAVRSAFVLLEERLRKSVGEDRMTGTQLANFAFNSSDGQLAKQLGYSTSEREGLREIYSGAFKLFRNPTAHGVVEYSAAEGKAIIGFVDLLLRLLKRAEELPPPGLLPENLENAIIKIEESIGPGATSRLRNFLAKCVGELGLKPSVGAKQWIPLRKHAHYKDPKWEEYKPHNIGVFYLVTAGKRRDLHFPITQYYSFVEGFNTEQIVERLIDLGFYPKGTRQEPTIDLKIHNDPEFFESLFDIVAWVADELQETLK